MSETNNGDPDGMKVDEMSLKLIAELQQYRDRCKAEDPATSQDERTLFESWATQKIAGLTVLNLELRTWVEKLAAELERRRK